MSAELSHSQQRLEDQRAAEQKILLMVQEKKTLESRLELRYRELQDQFGMFNICGTTQDQRNSFKDHI